jgi:hypothetical protein
MSWLPVSTFRKTPSLKRREISETTVRDVIYQPVFAVARG